MKEALELRLSELASSLVTPERFQRAQHVGDEALQDTIEMEPVVVPFPEKTDLPPEAA